MNKILISFGILLPYGLNGLVFSFVNPVFPLLAQSRQVPPFIESLFFNLFAVPQLFAFLYLPAVQRKCGVKNSYVAHLLLGAVSVFLLSFLYYTHSTVFFCSWSLLFRFMNGFSDAGIAYQYRPIAKRLLPSYFQLINEVSIAIFILFYGIGPVIAAPITAKYGFHVACFIISAITLLATLLVQCTLSSRDCQPVLEYRPFPQEAAQQQNLPRTRPSLTYCEFLSKPRVLSNFFLMFLSFYLKIYFVPFFSVHLKKQFNIPVSQMGTYYLVLSLVGVVSATPGVSIMRQCLRFTTILLIGVILTIIGNSVMGLSPIFGIPRQIIYVWIGLVTLSIGITLLEVPFMPYIIDYYERHPSQLQGLRGLTPEEQSEEIASKSSGAFTLSIGVSELLGPIIGRALYQWVGYSWTFTIMSVVTLGFGIVFLIYGGVLDKSESELTFQNSNEIEDDQVKKLIMETQ